jgi:hypothetical protein
MVHPFGSFRSSFHSIDTHQFSIDSSDVDGDKIASIEKQIISQGYHDCPNKGSWEEDNEPPIKPQPLLQVDPFRPDVFDIKNAATVELYLPGKVGKTTYQLVRCINHGRLTAAQHLLNINLKELLETMLRKTNFQELLG